MINRLVYDGARGMPVGVGLYLAIEECFNELSKSKKGMHDHAPRRGVDVISYQERRLNYEGGDSGYEISILPRL